MTSASRVDRGEVLALIGENGAGKSTLMKILGGVVEPSNGTIRIDGVEHMPSPSPMRSAAGIAFVHQELNLFDNLDVAANVFIGREPLQGGPLRLIDSAAIDAGSRPSSSGSGSISSPTLRLPTSRSPSASSSRSSRRFRSMPASSSWTSRPRASPSPRPSGS